MKKFALLTVATALGLMGLGAGNILAASSTNGLASTFTIIALFSPTNSPVMSTNHNGAVTVYTETFTTKTVTITTKDILNLLAREFNTTFPAGAQLAYALGQEGFVVLDNKGNVFLNVSANAADSSYRFSLTNTDQSNISVVKGTEISTKNTSTTNTVVNITYTICDYAIYYADGKGNDFHFSGVATLSENGSENASTSVIKSISIILSGSGGGTFFNPADGRYDKGVFTTATWRATGVNIPE
jgi:hypothetical protein